MCQFFLLKLFLKYIFFKFNKIVRRGLSPTLVNENFTSLTIPGIVVVVGANFRRAAFSRACCCRCCQSGRQGERELLFTLQTVTTTTDEQIGLKFLRGVSGVGCGGINVCFIARRERKKKMCRELRLTFSLRPKLTIWG